MPRPNVVAVVEYQRTHKPDDSECERFTLPREHAKYSELIEHVARMGYLITKASIATEVNATTAADRRDASIMRLATCRAKRTRTVGSWDVTVNHDPAQRDRGWFENNVNGNGGSLRFEGRRLVDYDGVYELPGTVKAILADLGYVLDEFTR